MLNYGAIVLPTRNRRAGIKKGFFNRKIISLNPTIFSGRHTYEENKVQFHPFSSGMVDRRYVA